MKGASDRTKVVLRHLPPTITQSMLMEQIDGRFAGRYNWIIFRPGNNSFWSACGVLSLDFKRKWTACLFNQTQFKKCMWAQRLPCIWCPKCNARKTQKHQSYSRAYMDFQRPEDVIEFAEFFGGHVFVNEKGTQFKTMVEYAPSQRVPKQWSKKDGREGTICKDLEYVEFLEFIAKPVENLPSAEIQLERREAERAGAAKDAPILTPLMDFVRQKRAAKGGSRRSLSNGKLTRRTGGTSGGSPSPASLKRGSEKRKVSTTMYVVRDIAKSTVGKDKSTYIMVPKPDDKQISEKSVSVAASGTDVLEAENGVSGTTNNGKTKILLLKGKEKEIPVPGGLSLKQTTASRVTNSGGVAVPRQNHRREASGKIIRSILLNKNSRQSPSVLHSDAQIQTSNQEDKRPPRPSNVQLFLRDANGVSEDRVVANDLHGFCTEKQEKRTRNKDRPDRGVWTPLRRSDGSHASDESLSSSTSQHTQSLLDPAEGTHGDTKNDVLSACSGDFKHIGSRRISHSAVDNGTYKHVGRRGPQHNLKDTDGSLIVGEGKPLKRGGSSSYSSHEKQVWVQKSSSGS